MVKLEPISSKAELVVNLLGLPDELRITRDAFLLCLIKFNSAFLAYNEVENSLQKLDPSEPIFPENTDLIYVILGRVGNLFSDLHEGIKLIDKINGNLNENGFEINFPSELKRNRDGIRELRNDFMHVSGRFLEPNGTAISSPSDTNRVKVIMEEGRCLMDDAKPLLIKSRRFLMTTIDVLGCIHNERASMRRGQVGGAHARRV